MSSFSANNLTYTAADIVGALGRQIYRTNTATSTDVFPTTATLMVAEFGVASADFNNEWLYLSITNNSTFTITQNMGLGQALIPSEYAGSYSSTTIVPGTGYTAGSGLATTGGSGTGMTVTITETGGAIDTVTIDDPGSGYFAGDVITVSGGGGTGGTFTLVISDVILPGQARYYNFVVVNGTTPTMNVIIRSDNSSETTGINLASGQILVGQSDGQAAGVTPSGDISSISTSGAFTANSATVALLAGAQTFTGAKTFDSQLNIGPTGDLRLIETGGGADYIELTAPAAVTTTYSITLPPAVGTTGQILRTTDGAGTLAWVTPSDGSLSYYYAYGPTTGVTITNSATVVNISNGEISSVGNFSNTGGVITITNGGIYKISFAAQFQTLNQTGGQNASFGAQVAVNGSALTGSLVETDIREQNSTLVRPSVSKVVLANITAGQTVEIQVLRTIGTTTGQTRPDQCTITLEQMD